jgi:hypothetical protein
MHYCAHRTFMEQWYLWWFVVWFINFTVLPFGQCFTPWGLRWQLWVDLKTSFHYVAMIRDFMIWSMLHP